MNVQFIKTAIVSHFWHTPVPARERASKSTGSLSRAVQVREPWKIHLTGGHCRGQDNNGKGQVDAGVNKLPHSSLTIGEPVGDPTGLQLDKTQELPMGQSRQHLRQMLRDMHILPI